MHIMLLFFLTEPETQLLFSVSSRLQCISALFLVSVVQIDTYFERDLMRSLEIYRQSTPEGNKTIKDDFDAVHHLVNDMPHCLSSQHLFWVNVSLIYCLY